MQGGAPTDSPSPFDPSIFHHWLLQLCYFVSSKEGCVLTHRLLVNQKFIYFYYYYLDAILVFPFSF